MMRRLAAWCFRHHWRVIGAWVACIVGVMVLAGAGGSRFSGSMELPNSDAKDGFAVLDRHFGGFGSGREGSIVFTSTAGVRDPEVQRAMTALFAKVDAKKGVTLTSPYDGPRGAAQISPDDRTAFAALDLDLDQTASGELGAAIAKDLPDLPGLTVELGGQSLAAFEPPQSEMIGVAFAIVVLILAFGSVLAMGLPIGVALGGVGTGIGLITLLSRVTTVPEFATTIGAMIGLGVGIDYALFIVTRYREGLAAGHDPETATVDALDTAGRAVVFAGLTVVVSLLGMLLMGLAFVSGLGMGAAITVAVTMLASITLLPAFLALAGHRVELTRRRGLIAAGLVAIGLLGRGLGVPPLLAAIPLAVVVLLAGLVFTPLKQALPARRHRPYRETLAYRWSHQVQAHPWRSVLLGAGILAVLSIPLFSLHLGFSDEGNYPKHTTTRKAYDLLSKGFGPGFNGPLVLTVVPRSGSDGAEVAKLAATLGSTPGVAAVSPPFPSPDKEAYLLRVIPTTAPQTEATANLVRSLRTTSIPAAVGDSGLDVNITGQVAVGIDFTDYLSKRLVLFFGVVLALSFLLLMVVFRSVLVPLKAVIMNMLSIGAAYGVVVAVFQWGWLGSLFGVAGAPIEPFIPMMMFAILFGLSMDYEVFLLSRVKEEYDRTGDPVNSVADGLAATARVISAAAAIMVVVFGSFLFEDNRIPKLFGLGLATAVFLDATLVRMLLVPATMELLGARNWWLPRWLDRILPRIDVEGHVPEDLHPLGAEELPERGEVLEGSLH